MVVLDEHDSGRVSVEGGLYYCAWSGFDCQGRDSLCS